MIPASEACGVHYVKTNLAIFHYHLFPGGVTSVVSLSVRAILAHLPEVEHITLVCGSDRHIKSIQHHLIDEEAAEASRITFEVVPEIFYLSHDVASHAGAEVPDTARLKHILRSRFAGALWWIHNYHLGKNPVFTQALLEIAEEAPDQRMLFHIHDFPECARYENLALLQSFVTHPLYPTSKNVRYAVINNRDLTLLRRSGIPEEQVFLLNNPVPGDLLPTPDRHRVRGKLEESFAGRFPGYQSGAPLLFYPVRTIRRKNVFEAGLIAAISPARANLIVTLPGVSERELPYSELVEESFADGTIPGMWGIGSYLAETGIGFQALALSTDCVISSSVQEGFGYLFIDGRRWRKPVFARYLDVLEGITEIIDGRSAFFYREVRVPLDGHMRATLIEAYRSRTRSIESFLSDDAVETLYTSIEGAFSGDTVDFSYLSVDGQRRVLEGVNDPSRRAELVELNRGPLAALERLMKSSPEEIGARIQANFSLEAFAERAREIFASYEAVMARRSPAEERIHERLRAGFASMEYIRLLYE